jgi:(2R)-ethylmalonyl-CoA mutase
MPPSIECAKAGITTGEWAQALRGVFGEYRAPTGVSGAPAAKPSALGDVPRAVKAVSKKLGRPVKLLVGKPGLDGHSSGAEQIALRARDCGMEVIYQGIRLTPAEIVSAALEEDVDIVGLSILSGSHVPLAREVMGLMQKQGLGDVPVILGGIIPLDDACQLKKLGIAAVYTPKDFQLDQIIADMVELVDKAPGKAD